MAVNKITLIIPDLHHKWEQAEKIIASVGADEIIFLGDYFDDFNDTPDTVRDTCEWLEGSVTNPNRIHLFGNHDQQYAFVYRTFQCAGYTQWKYLLINDIISYSVWDKLKWYHFLDGKWLLSHGGLHKFNVPDSITKYRTDRPKFVSELSGYLDHEIRKGFQAGAEGVRSWVFNAGHARWGSQRVGGITWCDFTREFYPIRGINQIVGHTPQQYGVKWCLLTEDAKIFHHPFAEYTPTPESLDNTEISTNICLDIHGNIHYGIWDGKTFKIGNYRDL